MGNAEQIAVVTGANRGLGLETCRQLAARGIRVVLTARDEDKARAAAESLQNDDLPVQWQALDVTDSGAIDSLAEYISNTFGRLNILVNNAGVFGDPLDQSRPGSASVTTVDLETIRSTFETNTLGALQMTRTLLPLMNGRGNIVNVSSGMGQLSDMNGCCPAYRLSKTALNAVTRIFADELQNTGIKINSVCPGWVKTDMGGANAERDLATGASGIVWAACLEEDGPSGGFFRDGKPIPW